MPLSTTSGKTFSGSELVTAEKLHQLWGVPLGGLVHRVSATGFDDTDLAAGHVLVERGGTAPTDTTVMWHDDTNGMYRAYDGTHWAPLSMGLMMKNVGTATLAQYTVVVVGTVTSHNMEHTTTARNDRFIGVVQENVGPDNWGLVRNAGKSNVRCSTTISIDAGNGIATSTIAGEGSSFPN